MIKCRNAKKITIIHKKTPQKRCFNSTRKFLDFDYINLFGSSIARRAPQFFNAIRDSDPREVALCVNLFTTTQRVQFGRSVVAQSAAAQLCGRGTSFQTRHKKKERFHVLFGAC